VDQIVHVDKDIAVCLHDIPCIGAEGCHPPHAHHGLKGEVVVGIDKVLHHNVMENLTLLLHHLVQHSVCVHAQQKDCENVDVAVGAFIPPGLPDGLPCIKLLVRGADKDDQEGRDAFALFRLVNYKFKGMWVEGPGADVGEGDVFGRFCSLPYWQRHVANICGCRARNTQVPQSARPADHSQQV